MFRSIGGTILQDPDDGQIIIIPSGWRRVPTGQRPKIGDRCFSWKKTTWHNPLNAQDAKDGYLVAPIASDEVVMRRLGK